MQTRCLLLPIAAVVPLAMAVGVAAHSAQADDCGPRERANRRTKSEQRAVAFLSREVPRWSVENKCFSCHNNGDAARALYVAVRRGERIAPKALADTTAWLARPDGWKHNGGEGPFSDKKLADLQFAAALADAVEARLIDDLSSLIKAARMVAAHQEKDGSWSVDAGRPVGSPATWGRALATAISLRTLSRAAPKQFEPEITRAEGWLRRQRPKTVLEAAAVLLGLSDNDDKRAADTRRHCLEIVRKGEAAGGGWGPYVNSAPEPFDTAVVLLALSSCHCDDRRDEKDIREMIDRGRRSLIKAQSPDGSWPETTRPPDGESYAQRLSTTGWATLALQATRPPAARTRIEDEK